MPIKEAQEKIDGLQAHRAVLKDEDRTLLREVAKLTAVATDLEYLIRLSLVERYSDIIEDSERQAGPRVRHALTKLDQADLSKLLPDKILYQLHTQFRGLPPVISIEVHLPTFIEGLRTRFDPTAKTVSPPGKDILPPGVFAGG